MKRGFTMVEVLVTIVLVSVALVGVFGGLRSLQVADARAQTADLLQRLASEKIADLKLLGDPSTGAASGDFADRGYADVTWATAVEAMATTDVDKVTVTATRGRASQALTTLFFVRPSSSSLGAPAI